MKLLIAATGSELNNTLNLDQTSSNLEIKFIPTKNSLHFLNLNELVGIDTITDENEWETWKKIRDPVLHIDLRNWADMILISPLDANTLSKLANGQCDNLVTCVMRAWDPKKPVILCPAMNTYMWDHPFTERHISFLKKELGYLFLDPITKQLACGDYGIGAMADVKDIVAFVKRVKEEFNIK